MGKNKQEYEVQSIIGKRRKKNSGSVQYRVLWKGYPKEQSTWEPEEHLENVQYMIDEFNQRIQQRGTIQPKKQTTQPQQIITPPKRVQEEIPPIVQEPKRREIPQKTIKKITKDSDDEYNQVEEENVDQKKMRGLTATRGKSPINRIQQETKTVERKVIPPSRNGIKSSVQSVGPHSPTEIKRPQSLKNDNQKLTNIEDDTGFSSDEDSNQILEVTGMFINQNGKFGFSVLEKKNNRRTTLRRRQLLKRDPLALIRFYEKSLNIIS